MFTIKWIGPDGSLKAQDSGEEEARLLVDGGILAYIGKQPQ